MEKDDCKWYTINDYTPSKRSSVEHKRKIDAYKEARGYVADVMEFIPDLEPEKSVETSEGDTASSI